MKWLLATLAISACASTGIAAQEPDAQVVEKLKAIHGAFEAYRKDHQGAYPPLLVADDHGGNTFWPELLKPYVQDDSPAGQVDIAGVFFSPYVPNAEKRGGMASVVSFGYNRYALGGDAGGKSAWARHPVTEIPDPDNTILLAEVDAPNQPGTGWYAAWPDKNLDYARYEGKSHVLFASGRVALLSPDELTNFSKGDTDATPWHGDLSK